MKKISMSFLLIITLAVFIFLATTTIKGIVLYKKTMANVVLEDVVIELSNKDNYVPIENISKDFTEILVAVEDHRFYEHNGFDFISFGRAILRNLKQQKFAAGGSTITQQLAKNMFFSFDKALERKVAEYIVAKQIEALLDKATILEIYVNIIYYGDNYVGIKDASYGYFDVPPADLTYAQSLLLAGLPQAPSLYALSTHFDDALIRSDQVMEILYEQGLINQEDLEKLKRELRSLQ